MGKLLGTAAEEIKLMNNIKAISEYDEQSVSTATYLDSEGQIDDSPKITLDGIPVDDNDKMLPVYIEVSVPNGSSRQSKKLDIAQILNYINDVFKTLAAKAQDEYITKDDAWNSFVPWAEAEGESPYKTNNNRSINAPIQLVSSTNTGSINGVSLLCNGPLKSTKQIEGQTVVVNEKIDVGTSESSTTLSSTFYGTNVFSTSRAEIKGKLTALTADFSEGNISAANTTTLTAANLTASSKVTTADLCATNSTNVYNLTASNSLTANCNVKINGNLTCETAVDGTTETTASFKNIIVQNKAEFRNEIYARSVIAPNHYVCQQLENGSFSGPSTGGNAPKMTYDDGLQQEGKWQGHFAQLTAEAACWS